MKTVLIIHDAYQTPIGAWYSRISSIIPTEYHAVTPELPGESMQGSSHWMPELEKYRDQISSETIIIAHGLGVLAAMRLIESLTTSIRMFISIAGTAEAPSHQVYKPIAETFLETPINFLNITKNAGKVFHIWNKQDPFIAPQLSAQFAEKLPGKNFTLDGSGHFLESNETELIQILRSIFEIVDKEDIAHNEQMKFAQTEAEKERIAKASIPALVTYDTGVAQSVAGYQGKVISELLSEARAREAEVKEKNPTNIKNLLYIAGTVILLLTACGFLGAAIIAKIPKTAAPVQRDTRYDSKLIRVESIVPFEFAGKEVYQVKKDLRAIQTPIVPEKTFTSIVPVQGGVIATLESFRASIDLNLPVGFTAKADDYVYGYYAIGNGATAPYLLVKFDGYDLLYTIMRNWEPNMFRDMAPLLYPDEPDTGILKSESSVFTDTVTDNIPMRVATMSNNNTITYTFLTDHILLITTNPGVAEPLLRRMIGR